MIIKAGRPRQLDIPYKFLYHSDLNRKMAERFTPTRSPVLYAIESTVLRPLDLNYEIIGWENIDKTHELLGDKKNVVAILDHKSLADTASGAIAAFKHAEINRLLQDAVIVIKIKYTEQFPTGFLLKSIRTIPVVSPTMEGNPRQKEVNRRALRTAKALADGTLLIITPEATRVNTGKMEKARKEVTSFWHRQNETWLWPIAVEGTEKQWPLESGGTSYYWRKGRVEHKARLIFGPPVKVADIRLEAQQYAGGDRQNCKQLEVDLAMLKIALLHIHYGDRKYTEGYYADLLADLERKAGVNPN